MSIITNKTETTKNYTQFFSNQIIHKLLFSLLNIYTNVNLFNSIIAFAPNL
jgi:hypothetical protein